MCIGIPSRRKDGRASTDIKKKHYIYSEYDVCLFVRSKATKNTVRLMYRTDDDFIIIITEV